MRSNNSNQTKNFFNIDVDNKKVLKNKYLENFTSIKDLENNILNSHLVNEIDFDSNLNKEEHIIEKVTDLKNQEKPNNIILIPENKNIDINIQLLEKTNEIKNANLNKKSLELNNFVHDNDKNIKNKKKIWPWFLGVLCFLFGVSSITTMALWINNKNNSIGFQNDFQQGIGNLGNYSKIDIKNLDFNAIDFEKEFTNNINFNKYFEGPFQESETISFSKEEQNSLISILNSKFFLNNNFDSEKFINMISKMISWNYWFKNESKIFGTRLIKNQNNKIIESILLTNVINDNGKFQQGIKFENILFNDSIYSSVDLIIHNFQPRILSIDSSLSVNVIDPISYGNETPINLELRIVSIIEEYLINKEYIRRNNDSLYLEQNIHNGMKNNIVNNSYDIDFLELNKINENLLNFDKIHFKIKSILNDLSNDSFEKNSLKDLVLSSLDEMDKNKILTNVSEIINNPLILKEHLTYLGVQEFIEYKNRKIFDLKIDEIKISHISIKNINNSIELSLALKTKLTYNNNYSYESYIYIEPSLITDDFTINYHVSRKDNDATSFSKFDNNEWAIGWLGFELKNLKYTNMTNVFGTNDEDKTNFANDLILGNEWHIENFDDGTSRRFLDNAFTFILYAKQYSNFNDSFEIINNKYVLKDDKTSQGAFDPFYYSILLNSTGSTLPGQSQRTVYLAISDFLGFLVLEEIIDKIDVYNNIKINNFKIINLKNTSSNLVDIKIILDYSFEIENKGETKIHKEIVALNQKLDKKSIGYDVNGYLPSFSESFIIKNGNNTTKINNFKHYTNDKELKNIIANSYMKINKKFPNLVKNTKQFF